VPDSKLLGKFDYFTIPAGTKIVMCYCVEDGVTEEREVILSEDLTAMAQDAAEVYFKELEEIKKKVRKELRVGEYERGNRRSCCKSWDCHCDYLKPIE